MCVSVSSSFLFLSLIDTRSSPQLTTTPLPPPWTLTSESTQKQRMSVLLLLHRGRPGAASRAAVLFPLRRGRRRGGRVSSRRTTAFWAVRLSSVVSPFPRTSLTLHSLDRRRLPPRPRHRHASACQYRRAGRCYRRGSLRSLRDEVLPLLRLRWWRRSERVRPPILSRLSSETDGIGRIAQSWSLALQGGLHEREENVHAVAYSSRYYERDGLVRLAPLFHLPSPANCLPPSQRRLPDFYPLPHRHFRSRRSLPRPLLHDPPRHPRRSRHDREHVPDCEELR